MDVLEKFERLCLSDKSQLDALEKFIFPDFHADLDSSSFNFDSFENENLSSEIEDFGVSLLKDNCSSDSERHSQFWTQASPGFALETSMEVNSEDEKSSQPGEESSPITCDLTEKISSQSEDSHSSSDGTSSDTDSNKSNSRRGRPKQEKSITIEQLSDYIIKELYQEMVRIEREYHESLDEKSTDSRKREDKPRTKIIRLIKRIPNLLLKKLVSIGDYKHADSSRLSESYRKAFEGLKLLLQFFNLIDVHRSIFNEENFALIAFCGIAFPLKKICKVASFENICSENEIKDLVKGRNGTSIKKLRALNSKNPMYQVLLKFTFETLRHFSELQHSLSLLQKLANL